MSGFWCGAAGLALLAWAMLCGPGLAGRRPRNRATRTDLEAFRHQLATLDAELAAGVIDADERRIARGEIERRVSQETSSDPGQPRASASLASSRRAALWLAVCIPLAAFGIYGFVGNPDGALPHVSSPAPGAATQGPERAGP